MDRGRHERLVRIYEAVAAVGDALGSESTSGGLVIPHAFAGRDEAVRGYFPDGFAWRPAPFGALRALAQHVDAARFDAVARLLDLVAPHAPEFAHLGGPDFDPAARDRGAFYLALHLDAMDAFGWRVLIAFPRVET